MKPPAGMVLIDGGVFELGHYSKDELSWGKREVFLDPYYIDVRPQPIPSVDVCYDQRKAREPRVAELEHALQTGRIEKCIVPEIASDIIGLADPKEAQELADAEGVGNYEVYVTTGNGLIMNLPYDDFRPPNWQRRCALSVLPDAKPLRYRVTRDALVRSGRGNKWPPLLELYHSSTKPAQLNQGTAVELIHRDSGWAYVRISGFAPAIFADGAGWVPMQSLEPVK